jgi:hypothetical protein
MSFEQLKATIDAGEAVLVIGSGVSAATTAGAACATWSGLIENAIGFITPRTDNGQMWREMVDAQLRIAREGSDPDQLEQAANQVGQKFLRIGRQPYADWLDDTIGSLIVEDDSVIKALIEIDAPILTTNYDTLIENVSGRQGYHWLQPRELQRAIINKNAIAHVHGIYTNPESIVLTAADYARQGDSPAVQALQQALSASKTMIYIGCGGTLEDPNFSRLLDWHRQTFKESAVRHYRLCRDGELSDLIKTHSSDNITPVSFGAEHSDLGQFLRGLGNPRQTEIQAQQRDFAANLRDLLIEDISATNLLLNDVARGEVITVQEAAIPPILLDSPPDTPSNSENAETNRLDPESEARSEIPMLLVAEEGSGLTTSLRWLLYHRSLRASTSIPIYVDATALPAGKNPLQKFVQKTMFTLGATQRLGDPTPECLIAIDNFPSAPKAAGRIMDDLVRLDALSSLIVGSSNVNQAQILTLLGNGGVSPDIRYVGRVGTSEVREMAARVSPTRAQEISEVVIGTIRKEHLPRTPFNASVLISIVLRGEALASLGSPTAILEQYVNHLLGRDDILQNARTELSPADREVLLWEIAIGFLDSDTGALDQETAVSILKDAFSRYGWTENPTAVIVDLTERRLIRQRGSQIVFAQSAYLHLFAAKAAARRPAIKQRLLEKPLYYSYVLRSYAALVRHDEEVLASVGALLEGESIAYQSSMFDEIEKVAAPDTNDLVEFSAAIAQGGDPDDQETPESSSTGEVAEYFDDTDIVPFPAVTDDELAGLARHAQSLALVSTVLRESDEVENLPLKAQILRASLHGWARLTDVMLHDPDFIELADKIKREAPATDPAIDREQLDALIKAMPAIIAYSGLAGSLASRKLLEILNIADGNNDVRSSVEASAGAVMFLHATDLRESSQFARFIRPWISRSIVQDFLHALVYLAFLNAQAGSDQEKLLRDLIADIECESVELSGEVHRQAYRGAVFARIDKDKRRHVKPLGR